MLSTNTKRLSAIQKTALDSIKENGKLIATMVGSVGWSYRWQNPKVIIPTPKTLTIKSLMKRKLLFHQAFHSHPVEGELIVTANQEDCFGVMWLTNNQ